MLTKLISHEWKDTFKVPVLLLTITVLLSAASLVYFSVADQATADIDLNVRNFVLYIAYILILSGLSMILTIYFAIRFYKNLYTDEGYLMHTLPVKPWMLIVSKLTIGTIWFYLIDLLLVGAIYLDHLDCPAHNGIFFSGRSVGASDDVPVVPHDFHRSLHTLSGNSRDDHQLCLFPAYHLCLDLFGTAVFQPQGARIHPVLSRAEHHPFDRYDASDRAYDRRRVHHSIDFCESDG